MPIKLILADDHQLFREGLANLLSESTEVEVIAQAVNGKDAIEKAKKLRPDILIMDINMPEMDGVEATSQLLKEVSEIKIIGLSIHANKQYIKGMLEAGSSGYLFKNCSYDELIKAIQTVHSGKKYLSEKITEILIKEYLNKEEIGPSTTSELTDRESEILKLIAEGISVSDISNRLFVSIKTINTHKQHILEKLNLKTTTDIIKYALKKGIISLD
jgi:DNA-binding NarL/FixJ family response regulator